ncbi:MFS transporter [Actinomadura sp. GTD37]|uniref:MFS transporter n=1 Tax=Actinomadura sp. GTD37 TaxID=1778030 RepID=UPI0035C127FF
MKGRDFTLLWSASAASQMGSMCLSAANPLLALLLTHSPVVAGWVGAASTIPALLMHLPAGWLVDRCDRRLLMFAGQLGRLTACSLPVCAIVFDSHPTVLLILGAFFEGIFHVLYNAAEVTAVQRVVDSAELPSALATNEARRHLAVMAGKPLGGFLFSLEKSFPYLVSALSALCSIFALFAMTRKDFQPRRASGPPTGKRGAAPGTSFLGSLRVVLLSPFLRTVIVVCAIGNFLFQTVLLLLVVQAEEQHMSSTKIGLLLATSGVGGLVGSVVAPKAGRRMREESIIKLCVMAWAVLILVVALTGHPVVGLIAWGCLSVTGGFLNVAVVKHQTTAVPEHLLGQVMGINRFVTSGAVPLGALSAGYLIAELRPEATAWVVLAAMVPVVAAVPYLFHPSRLLPAAAVAHLRKMIPAARYPAAVTAAPVEEAADSVPAY